MKTKIILLLALASVIAVTCKKEEKKQETAPASNGGTVDTSVAATKMTAKVNDSSWVMTCTQSFCFLSIVQDNLPSPPIIEFMGTNKINNKDCRIAVSFPAVAGVYQLKDVEPVGFYKDTNNIQYPIQSGAIRINYIESVGGSLPKKLKATFFFSTAAVNGKSFSVTDGVLEYKK